jgi:hypothetical protein
MSPSKLFPLLPPLHSSGEMMLQLDGIHQLPTPPPFSLSLQNKKKAGTKVSDVYYNLHARGLKVYE